MTELNHGNVMLDPFCIRKNSQMIIIRIEKMRKLVWKPQVVMFPYGLGCLALMEDWHYLELLVICHTEGKLSSSTIFVLFNQESHIFMTKKICLLKHNLFHNLVIKSFFISDILLLTFLLLILLKLLVTCFRYGVIPTPEVTPWRPLSENDSYLVVASDGVFERMTTIDVCKLLRDVPMDMADSFLGEYLVNAAYNGGSWDNLSAIVIPLDREPGSKAKAN